MVWYLNGDLKDKMIAIRIMALASACQTIGFTDKYYYLQVLQKNSIAFTTVLIFMVVVQTLDIQIIEKSE